MRIRVPCFLAGLLALLPAGCGGDKAPEAPAPSVVVAEALQQDVPVYMEFVGQTVGYQDVDIRARVEGFLDSISFKEGAFVTAGDLLYQIDPKPLQAALAQARANMATSQARLDQAVVTVNRMKPLAAQQAVSLQELDNAMAAENAARAQVDAGRAAVEKAELDLGYATISSPIDGVVGITQVKAGNLVGAGEATLLTVVSQIDPILFRGGISEADYLRLMRTAEERRASMAGKESKAELRLSDGTVFPHPGTLDAIERAVDTSTGTLSLQIAFPNPDRLLRPGQYGRARFVTEIRPNALLVQQRAVQELQDKYNVMVVDEDNKVSVRSVRVGPRHGDMWVIEEGLQPGERVIVEGLQRLRDGMTVNPGVAQPPAAGQAVPATADGGSAPPGASAASEEAGQ